MPAIKKESRTQTEQFKMLSAASDAMNETNDCSVKAVALACGVDYATAHAAMARRGRKNRRGAYTRDIIAAISDLGFDTFHVPAEHFISKYPKAHQVLKGCTTHHPERFNKVWADGNTYVMFTSRHVLTIINGQNHDWTVGRAKRSEAIYRVVAK